MYTRDNPNNQNEFVAEVDQKHYYSPAYITNTKNPKVSSEAGMFPIHSSNPVTIAVQELPNTHVPATPILVNVYGVT